LEKKYGKPKEKATLKYPQQGLETKKKGRTKMRVVNFVVRLETGLLTREIKEVKKKLGAKKLRKKVMEEKEGGLNENAGN